MKDDLALLLRANALRMKKGTNWIIKTRFELYEGIQDRAVEYVHDECVVLLQEDHNTLYRTILPLKEIQAVRIELEKKPSRSADAVEVYD